MSTTKKITTIALYVAILLGGQLALSGISGVEIVTVLLLSFCCVYGLIMGVAVATVFSIIRCLLFGFYPSVIILYLVYYNMFAIFFGSIGKRLTKNLSLLRVILIVLFSICFTALFTFLDDVITPLFYGFSAETSSIYFYASLYTLVPQLICTAITVVTMYIPVTRLLQRYG